MTPVRLALIGLGTWGRRYVEKLTASPEAVLAGVFDRDEARLREICSQFGLKPLASGDWSGIDGAVVATTTGAHHDVAMQCLNRGIHVLIEKPMAASAREAQDILRRARELEKVCQVGHIERFNPAWRHVEDKLHRPMYIETQRLAPYRERGTDVDVVLDLMIHDLDLVLAAAGAEPARVDAVGVSVLSREVDMVNARLEFDSGLVANLTASRVSPETIRKIRVFQPDGYFSVDLLNASVRHCRLGPDEDEKRIDEFREEIGKSDPLRWEIEDFVRSIRLNGRPKVTGEDGARALSAALAVKERVEQFLGKLREGWTRAKS